MTTAERLKLYRDEVAGHLDVVYPERITDWLMERGFFEAPASTHYHGTWEGGLFDHSLCVMRQLVLLTERNGLHWERKESPWIVGFFHDLCKVDQYTRVRDDESGHPVYAFNGNTLHSGHGEKSVMLLAGLMRLSEEEVACIRYHMGAFTDKDQWNNYTRAVHMYPNVLWTHTADMLASHVYDR